MGCKLKYRSREIVDAWEFDGRLDFSKTLPKVVKDATSNIRLNGIGQLKITSEMGQIEIDSGDFVIMYSDGTFGGMEKTQFNSKYKEIGLE